MQILQDYMLYPAQITLQLKPVPAYEMTLHTLYDNILTTGDSFAKVLKMGCAVLIDMSFVHSFEDTIPPVGHFKEHAPLVTALKGWLRGYTTGLDQVGPCEATYLKNSYLAQLVNLLAIAHWESDSKVRRTQEAIKHVLSLPLSECSPLVHAEVLPKHLATAKEESLQYLLARLFELNLKQGDEQLQKDLTILSKLANKRTNFTLKQDKLKPSYQGRTDEVAVLLPLNTALKFMLSNSILELGVKLRSLADDLGISVEQLEELLNVYETTSLPQLLKIFKRLGVQPDFNF